MKVLSLNVGMPRTVLHEGRTVRTGIYKAPADRPLKLTRLGFEGDGQADRRVHGGPNRAAYIYPHEHYAHWAPRLGGGPLPMGQFGENVTTEGLLEATAYIGDVYAIGGARIQLTTPRGPCFKLGIRTGDPGIITPFLESGRLGFYTAVLEEGLVEAGDDIALIHRDDAAVSFAELIDAMYGDVPQHARQRVLDSPRIPPDHKKRIERMLEQSA